MLKAPADQDLRGCPTIFRGDFLDQGVLKAPSPRERAVRLQLDVMLLAIFEEFSLKEERMELDLVHRWRDRGCTQEFLQMRDRVVAHPNRPCQSLLPDLQKRLPRFVPQLGHRPVNQIQVHVLETEFASAPVERPQRRFESLVAVPEFRGDEDLVPGNPALSYRGPYVSLVSIQSRRVDQTIARFEGGRDRLPCLLPGARLPHAKAKDGNLRADVQRDAEFDGEGHRGRDAARPT